MSPDSAAPQTAPESVSQTIMRPGAAAPNGRPNLLEVINLTKHFSARQSMFGRGAGTIRAIDGVSFAIQRGETLGLVGESGSGKTTTGRCILRAIEPTSGEVVFRLSESAAVDITRLEKKALRAFRRHAQMIFQDPYSSLNPRMTVRDIIGEPLVASGLAHGSELDDRIRQAALRCQLKLEHLRRYPHAFSGGQRQRIGIARALVVEPEFIVCDEAVSALDVSIQAQILNLLMDTQAEYGLTYLFIAHDLSVVEHVSDRVAVMYLGRIVELAPTRELFYNPLHPYTSALMSAIPAIDPDRRMQPITLEGEIPSPANPPPGCHFHPRCPFVQERCRQETPDLNKVQPGHFAACHFAGSLPLKGASET
jgi:peptide/nickel transport system ATP-binding protein